MVYRKSGRDWAKFSGTQARQQLRTPLHRILDPPLNVHGFPGKNIAADLHMEHLNRVCKEAIKGLGANKTPKAVSRIGNAMEPMYSILENFDRSVLKTDAQGRHEVASVDKDMQKILCQLQQVLKKHKIRSHSCFPKFKMICHQFHEKKLRKWIVEHIESWQ